MIRNTAIALSVLALSATSAFAQETTQPAAAPAGAKKASEILAEIESRADYSRLEEMNWDDDGYYEIVYHTNDKARVEINISATTGEPVEQR
jgi:uncharacterized membrane protein YkoI